MLYFCLVIISKEEETKDIYVGHCTSKILCTCVTQKESNKNLQRLKMSLIKPAEVADVSPWRDFTSLLQSFRKFRKK